MVEFNGRIKVYFKFFGVDLLQDRPGTKRIIAGIELSEDDVDWWRGKFRRTCEPKRMSGSINVPVDIFEQYQAKGQSRQKLFELFIKTNGDKEICLQNACLKQFFLNVFRRAWGIL